MAHTQRLLRQTLRHLTGRVLQELTCEPMCPACNPMCPACNPTYLQVVLRFRREADEADDAPRSSILFHVFSTEYKVGRLPSSLPRSLPRSLPPLACLPSLLPPTLPSTEYRMPPFPSPPPPRPHELPRI